MNQARIYFSTTRQHVEHLTEVLEGMFEEEAYAISSFEEDEAEGVWSISVYVPEELKQEVSLQIKDLLENSDIETVLACETIPTTGWVEKTLAGLAPVRAGRFVVHGSHDRDCVRPHEYGIEIDAGMAFGTGHHGTTAGCLEVLENVLKSTRIECALDLGCGTGVLAIALAKATRAQILASDIDPVAELISRKNAKLNGVGDLVEAITATGFSHRRFGEWPRFDLVVANILARPLQKLAPDIAVHLQERATVILSGLLPHQARSVQAAYRAQGLHLTNAREQDGWMVLTLRNY